ASPSLHGVGQPTSLAVRRNLPPEWVGFFLLETRSRACTRRSAARCIERVPRGGTKATRLQPCGANPTYSDVATERRKRRALLVKERPAPRPAPRYARRGRGRDDAASARGRAGSLSNDGPSERLLSSTCSRTVSMNR